MFGGKHIKAEPLFFISLCSEGRQPIKAPNVSRLLPFPHGIETTEVTEGDDQVIDQDLVVFETDKFQENGQDLVNLNIIDGET